MACAAWAAVILEQSGSAGRLIDSTIWKTVSTLGGSACHSTTCSLPPTLVTVACGKTAEKRSSSRARPREPPPGASLAGRVRWSR